MRSLLLAAALLSAPAGAADRVERLSTRTDNVGEQVTRSKAALELLQALVGVEAGTPGVRVVVENRLGGAYAVDALEVFLDEELLCAPDVAGWEPGASLPCREAPAASGAHTLRVRAALRGSGAGMFSYMEQATFELTSSSDVEVTSGGLLRVVLRTRGALTRSFWDRPEVAVLEAAVPRT